jgi:probable DNA metabolism protein
VRVDACAFFINGADELPPKLARLFALSTTEPEPFAAVEMDAFYAAIYAGMSGLPIHAQVSRFIEKVSAAPSKFAANRLARDRGDPDTLTVLKAAHKVYVEIHRLKGFLRFSPDAQGVYTAVCESDYFILPALAEHFSNRFRQTPWAIVDEKRSMRLCRLKDGEVRLELAENTEKNAETDKWQGLWRLYFRSLSNESRKNPRLQRQFIPERYRKHLNEL